MNVAIVNGGHELREGNVRLAGYKHMAVLALAFALGQDHPVRVGVMPDNRDLAIIAQIVESLGGTVTRGAGAWIVDGSGIVSGDIPESLSRALRGSLYLIPPILAKCGHVEFAGSGGCQLFAGEEGWTRPFDHIFDLLPCFGARLERSGGVTRITANRLHGAEIDILRYSDDPKVLMGSRVLSATKLAILIAQHVTSGTTVIRNPVCLSTTTKELLDLLVRAGYQVVTSSDEIRIGPRPPGGASGPNVIELIPDVSEAMTYVAMACVTRTPVSIMGLTEVLGERLIADELELLRAMGLRLSWTGAGLRVEAPDALCSVDVECRCNGGVLTDHQPLFALMLLGAQGPCRIVDHVWRSRWRYASELRRLGASFDIDERALTVFPGRPSTANQVVEGADVRAAAVLLLASLGVPGRTVVGGIHHLERGYCGLVERLSSLGADIQIRREEI
ncbi:MAG: hypothetical protein H6712_02440 [Myxococcales bacterium]|nr:hypothetical protein [Myxococcales bacterium]MCB9712687.1 hypothetical protein [Myxococcales bacterium]